MNVISVQITALLCALVSPLLAGTPEALRAHVSFLASDLLEGRNTPSRGLDLAAAYIKSQFQIIGLRVEEQVTTWSMVSNNCLPEPLQTACGFAPSPVRNVIGVLPGTGDEYVLVTAHYDHLGIRFPGANDDANV
ncbi:MAG: M28 family peptidase [Bryobacteraceae bacterium]